MRRGDMPEQPGKYHCLVLMPGERLLVEKDVWLFPEMDKTQGRKGNLSGEVVAFDPEPVEPYTPLQKPLDNDDVIRIIEAVTLMALKDARHGDSTAIWWLQGTTYGQKMLNELKSGNKVIYQVHHRNLENLKKRTEKLYEKI